ncbi:MIP/aquaporin family protein [Clostridium luticellarii]|jgi:glycerol uptake facilitator protein|uniref:Glycerol uptake facilitator protein n=1 Tax=Clostridium luticellarii TaxID=1691940 RepID=A0A2T0BMY9_9CLOT|nr:MIP/aquaporin family protein [Clostridium luticellarii]MCI1943990.1 aquaporin family protein [Clostridium luticellarii]MCI1967368.1 aquaporin family protein [Clostridium luticellarii]MCI1996093.1 aquaporin family protein [Clostridium luticellarii]MCI2039145.1 aquaporin family protein [Clostridium luticellarii]PRR85213.1 Glycerol uptake facilitator protein [Clostridium luticellarii]
MSHVLAEFVGTALLVYLGDSICANCTLNKSKGQNAGWIVIAAGWGIAVGVPAYLFSNFSNQFNPALTIGLAVIGKFPADQVLGYIIAQMLGGIVGGVLVWLTYLPHWAITEDKAAKLGIFCTAPAIRNYPANFLTEFLATATLVFSLAAMGTVKTADGMGAIFVVSAIIFVLGCALGGPTGYAMNPARDLSPRIAHAILPIAGKGDSDWAYAWVPVFGPIAGGIAGALLFAALF